jgi:hypothetical protein
VSEIMAARGDTHQGDVRVVVVSGLPRSGTSMMMRMLEAGGLPLLTDGIRKSDVDNPNGYYEFEPVKKLKDDATWVPDAQGKAVKIVYLLLYHLPANARYKVIFMRRMIVEVVASQDIMLRRAGVIVSPEQTERTIMHFDRQVRAIEAWLSQQDNFEVIYVDYNRILNDAAAICLQIQKFLAVDLDTARMQLVVTGSLYRQRAENLIKHWNTSS